MSKHVYLIASGGLGDIFQVYFSNPNRPEDIEVSDRYPSSDPSQALWFRRLRNFKSRHPDIQVSLVLASHNPNSHELFEYDPYIDEIIQKPYSLDLDDEGYKVWESEKERENNIQYHHKWSHYQPAPPEIYLGPGEKGIIDAVCNSGPFIAVHPGAGLRCRVVVSISDYRKIIGRLIDSGYKVVVLGKSYKKSIDNINEVVYESYEDRRRGVLSLVNKVSARVALALSMRCSGFIGSHSALILAAWYAGIKSVCLVPPMHDTKIPFEEFFRGTNPTTWGANREINKTMVINGYRAGLAEEVVGWFGG